MIINKLFTIQKFTDSYELDLINYSGANIYIDKIIGIDESSATGFLVQYSPDNSTTINSLSSLIPNKEYIFISKTVPYVLIGQTPTPTPTPTITPTPAPTDTPTPTAPAPRAPPTREYGSNIPLAHKSTCQ